MNPDAAADELSAADDERQARRNDDVIDPMVRRAITLQRQRIAEAVAGPMWHRAAVGDDGDKWALREGTHGVGMTVIWSIATELDRRVWLHVSVARVGRLPSYSDMTRIKRLFIGPDQFAYSVWAAEEDHVSIHDTCLHLWSPLTGELPLPDFTRGMGTI